MTFIIFLPPQFITTRDNRVLRILFDINQCLAASIIEQFYFYQIS